MNEITKKTMNTKDNNIGYTDRLPILRKKENLTQEQFAEKINVSAVLVSDMERQKKKLTLPNAIEIAKQFNVSLDWLYGLTDDTGDSVSNIIIALKDIFDIDFERKCIKVEENLFNFIEEMSNAYRIKSKKANNVSDKAFEYWLEGIKKSYNEKTKSDNVKYYHLQSNEEYLAELENQREP